MATVQTESPNQFLKQLYTALEKTHSSPDIASKLDGTLRKTQNVAQAFSDYIATEAVMPPEVQKTIELYRDVFALTNGDETLACYILQEEGKGVTTSAAVAVRFYYLDEAPPAGVSQSSLAAFKENLFRSESQSVMAAMVREGDLLATKQHETLRPFVLKALMEACRQGIAIKSPEFDELIYSSLFFKGVEASTAVDPAKVHAIIKAMQRLVYLVTDPLQIEQLLANNFRSAHEIAVLDKKMFKVMMKRLGMNEDEALRIHDHATAIDCRNQETWLKILQRIYSDFVAAPGTARDPKATDTSAVPSTGKASGDATGGDVAVRKRKAGKKFNLTDIFNLQATSCEECCSVISPAAYFVDLLEFLRTSPCKPSVDDHDTRCSVLDVLADRRPDLRHLELSCANSKNKLPYISIVIEILASYVESGGVANDDGSAIAIYNEDAKGSLAQTSGPNAAPAAQDVRIPPVFETKIGSQLFPLTVFPYNHGDDTIRTYLDRAGTSRLELLSTFKSELRTACDNAPELYQGENYNPTVLLRDAEAAVARAVVAETLGLQALDYAAISGHHVYSGTFLLSEDAQAPAAQDAMTAALSVCKLWGYDTLESMLDDDEEKGTGLCFIKAELLPRSGLSFEQLVELVDSLYFGRRLVITNDQGSKMFTSQVSEMRLRALDISRPEVTANTTEIVTKLDATLCRELQSFIRLKNKLGWSITELDTAVSCISQNLVANGIVGDIESLRGITPLMLEDLSHIVALSQLTRMSVPDILPLWSDITTHGKKSLYEKLFLRAVVATSGDTVFQPDEDGKFLTTASAIDEHLRTIQIAFGIRAAGLTALMAEAGLKPNDELNLANISLLYRYRVLCAMLSIDPEDFATVHNVFPPATNFFRDPGTSLRLVRSWKTLMGSEWTLESIKEALPSPPRSDYHSISYVKLASDISLPFVTALNEFQTRWTGLMRNKAVTEVEVADACRQLFDEQTAGAIVSLVEGKQPETSITVDASYVAKLPSLDDVWRNGKPKLSISFDLASQTSEKGTVTITLSGMLTDQEGETLVKICAKSHPAFLGCVKDIDGQATAPLRAAVATLCPRLDGANGKDVTRLLTSCIIEDPLASSVGASAEAKLEAKLLVERELRRRRMRFAELALPTLRCRTLEHVLFQLCKDKCGGLDTDLLKTLLNDVIRVEVPTNVDRPSTPVAAGTFKRPLEIIERLPFLFEDQAEVFSGFFSPESGQSFEFVLPAGENAEFAINGVKLPLTKTAVGGWQTQPVALAGGQQYHLVSSANLAQVYWTTKQNTRQKFKNVSLTPLECATTLVSVWESIVRVVAVARGLSLTAEEIRYLSSERSRTGVDLNNMSLSGLMTLEQYQAVRKSGIRDVESLLHLLRWLDTSSGQLNASELPQRLASTFGWSEAQTVSLLEAKFPKAAYDRIVDRLRNDLDELRSLQRAIELGNRINSCMSTALSLEVLFQLAMPAPPYRAHHDFKNAAALQSCIQESKRSRTVSALREKQRNALVQYLLQQDYIRKLEISQPDELFEHFLIDVQMGGQLDTTRMKQAISTVQLFVQRCLLGLEVQNGVLSSHIKQNKWKWMQKHATWVATRKAFLYPENWIDPTLRDDKTDLFLEYEAAIMQGDLSWEAFTGNLKKYVGGLGQIADLDMQTYLHEVEPNVSDTYHFFGRTRNAPYQYFYCKMRQDKDASHVFWSPWKRVDLDTLTYETDWDGTKLAQNGNYLLPVMRGNRLFLYMPQITLKTVPTEPKPQVTEKVVETDAEPRQKRKVVEPATFKSLKQQPITETKSPQNWEIRIAWTELFDDRWSSKKVSESSVDVEWAPTFATEPLPSLANFTFATSVTEPQVTINVGCWRAGGSSFHSLGKFEIREDRITATKFDAATQRASLGSVLPTKFHKYTWISPPGEPENTPVPSGNTMAANRKCTPLLAVTKQAEKKGRVLTWTLSFNTGPDGRDATGLIVDEQQMDKPNDGRSIFMYPRAHKLSSSVGSSILREQSDDAVVEHEQSPRLMEAVSSRSELALLFASIGNLPLRNFGEGLGQAHTAGRHELTLPYAIYNWEIGLHMVLLAMDRFAATQQFDLALRAARLIFDPTVDAVGETQGVTSTACWKFPPFRELASNKEDMVDLFEGWPTDATLDAAIIERRSNPSTAHSTARSRPQAYMKWVVMKYIEILVAAGDELFRRASLEDLPLAIQRYVEAAYVLGPDPPEVPKLGKPVVLSYADFTDKVDLELDFPFVSSLERRGAVSSKDYADPDDQKILCILTTPYFCLPPNPKYQALRNLVKDRLFKTRNNLDINGRPLIYSIDEPSIDPGDYARGLAAGPGGSSGLLGVDDGPIPYQRFASLLAKANELCTELRAITDQLLSIRERKDSEALALLKSRQDITRQNLIMSVKQLQQQEASLALESLLMQREAAVSNLGHLLQLIGEPLERIPDEKGVWEDIQQSIETPFAQHELRMSKFEKQEMDFADRAAKFNIDASDDDERVAWMRALPHITLQTQPWGMGVSVTADTHNIADGIHAYSLSKRTKALIASEKGHQASRKAQLTRQLQDRRLQANIKGRDIKNLDKQIEMQRNRLKIAAADIELGKLEAQFVAETQAWYQSKYSNEKLYGWMENTAKSLAYDIYLLAIDLARRAEKVFRFEKGPAAAQFGVGPFLRTGGYWDARQDGLLAGQQLALDLKRMEMAYLEKPAYDYEIVKQVSLRQIDPLALVRLRQSGSTTFSILEMLYDMDYPGHYNRRIKSVSASVPCITGPHTNLNGTLTLMQHKYRVRAVASTAKEYNPPDDEGSVQDQFRTDRIPISAVAISSGMQDSGAFELNFRDDRFMPFEFAGAISDWKLELPTALRQFDYQTISDVVLNIRYTALDGGPLLKNAATESVTNLCTDIEQVSAERGLVAFFDLKNDFSNEWYPFMAGLKRAIQLRKDVKPSQAQQSAIQLPKDVKPSQAQQSATPGVMFSLDGIQTRMPYWARGKTIKVRTVSVVTNGKIKGIEACLAMPILGDGAWTVENEPDSTTLVRDGLSATLSSAWTLEVTPSGTFEAADLDGISLAIRYAVIDPKSARGG